jgi:hypothetical protein
VAYNTDNTITQSKRTKRQILICKALHGTYRLFDRAIRSRKSKDSQYNNEKKKDKNDKQFSAKHLFVDVR